MGTEGPLPGEPGKLWRAKVHEVWVCLHTLILLMVCFAELIEQGWDFKQEVLWLVIITEACCEVVLDAWATMCHVIIFQGVCQKVHGLPKAG